jgi:DNA-binding MarR family transcriptional regulator
LTKTPEAPRGASECLAQSTEEVYAKICRELELIRRRLGSLADGDEREGVGPVSLIPAGSDEFQKRHLLSQVAANIYALRRRRNRHLPDSLVGEPAWDLLLSLFMEPSKSLTVGDACLAADVPATTGLRWIALLEQDGYLQRSKVELDRRRVTLNLTRKGCIMMEECLESMLSP